MRHVGVVEISACKLRQLEGIISGVVIASQEQIAFMRMHAGEKLAFARAMTAIRSRNEFGIAEIVGIVRVKQ